MTDLKPVAPYKEFTLNGKTYKRPGISPARAAMAAKAFTLKPGEYGTDENPVIKDGLPYVYSSTGRLVRRMDFDPETMELFVLEPVSQLTEEQKRMVKAAAERPIVYDDDCPKSSPERLERFRRYGAERNRRLKEIRVGVEGI